MVAVNLKTQSCDIRIDRKTRWGNPFIIGKDGNRDDVIAKYRTWLWDEIKAERISVKDLAELHDRKLGCHCAPLPCHGDVLTAAADWAYRQQNISKDKQVVSDSETDMLNHLPDR